MPVSTAYDRVVISGSLPGGESWACGFAITSDTSKTAQAQAVALAADSILINLLLALRPINTSGWRANALNLYRYPANAASASDVGTAGLGTVGQGTGPLPNQTSLVTTLRTAVATGRGRGRCYWPVTSMPLGADGLADIASVTAVNSAMADVMRKYAGLVVSEAAGVARLVTRVTTDNRTDVIRARAAKLVATRVSATVIA